MAGRSRALRFKLLLAFALLLVVAWSVLWFVAAAVVDRQAERVEMRAEADGTMLKCAHRSVKGFPFRIELRCGAGSRVVNAHGSATLEGLTVVGLIYNPNLVIAQVQSPVALHPAAAPQVAAEWDLAHGSARVGYAEKTIERFDVELLGAELTVGGVGPVAMDEVHVNVRRQTDQPADLDLAVRLVRAVPIKGGAPVTLAFRGELAGGGELMSSQADTALDALLAGGVPLTIDSATVASGDMLVSAEGSLLLKPDGRLDGDLELAIAGGENEVPYIEVVAPAVERTVRTLMRNVLSYAPETTIGDRKARKIALTIRDGRVRAGLVPLFTLPPARLSR